MSRNIIITYDLHPPADTPAHGLEARKTHNFAVNTGEGSLKAYYAGVRDAISQGKEVIGEELTAWRDAVGSREQTKESKVAKMEQDEEDEEDEEEEDDSAE